MKEPQTIPSARTRRRRARRLALVSLVAVVVLFVVDVLSGLVYRTSADASLNVTDPQSGSTQELLVVFQGYAADCSATANALRPELSPTDAMVVLCYAERGIDDEQVFQLVIRQVERLEPQRIRVLGGSLGGLVAARFLARYGESPAFRTYGEVVLVLDTAPSGARTVRRPQWLFAVSRWYRGGLISSGIWYLTSGLGSQPEPQEGASLQVIQEGNRANAIVGMPALTSQAAYIASFDPTEISRITGVVSRVAYLEGDPPEADPMVDVDAAISDWRAAFPDLQVIRIASRLGEWHIPWTYRPKETLDAVERA